MQLNSNDVVGIVLIVALMLVALTAITKVYDYQIELLECSQQTETKTNESN